MGAWLEALEKLQSERPDRVRRWIKFKSSIAQTLDIAWDDWVSDHLKRALENPLDHRSMQAYLPGFAGLDVGAGDFDPGGSSSSRIGGT